MKTKALDKKEQCSILQRKLKLLAGSEIKLKSNNGSGDENDELLADSEMKLKSSDESGGVEKGKLDNNETESKCSYGSGDVKKSYDIENETEHNDAYRKTDPRQTDDVDCLKIKIKNLTEQLILQQNNYNALQLKYKKQNERLESLKILNERLQMMLFLPRKTGKNE